MHHRSRPPLRAGPGHGRGDARHRREDLLQFARYRRGGGDDRLVAREFSAGLKDWEQAPAPAQIGRRVVEGVFQHQLPPERAALVNNLMHWGWGIAWGGLFGLVAGSLRAHGPPWLVLGATAAGAERLLAGRRGG